MSWLLAYGVIGSAFYVFLSTVWDTQGIWRRLGVEQKGRGKREFALLVAALVAWPVVLLDVLTSGLRGDDDEL